MKISFLTDRLASIQKHEIILFSDQLSETWNWSWALDDIFMFFNNILQRNVYYCTKAKFLECDYGVVVMKEGIFMCPEEKYSPVFMGKI